LKLFVTGNSPTSRNAIENLTRVANHALRRGFRLEIIDILRQPHEACAEGVFCTPMLVKKSPGPEAWILGELSDEARLLRAIATGRERRRAAGLSSARQQPRALLHPRRIVVIDDFEGIHDSFRVALDGALCGRDQRPLPARSAPRPSTHAIPI
jgi:circadian clock protein KaiB